MWHERPNTTLQHAAAAEVRRRPNDRPLLWPRQDGVGTVNKARVLSQPRLSLFVLLIVGTLARFALHPDSERAFSLKVPRDSGLPDDAADLAAEPLVHDGPPWDERELVGVLDEGVFA